MACDVGLFDPGVVPGRVGRMEVFEIVAMSIDLLLGVTPGRTLTGIFLRLPVMDESTDD
jgi:hypothetical protein